MAIKLILFGKPATKKNSQQIVRIGGVPRIIQSKAYRQYEKDCLKQIGMKPGIDYPVNVKCVYYMPTRRKVDGVNLIEATLDILVRAGVLADDNSSIVAGMDGSRVLYDKANPRVEITIEAMNRE